MLRAKVLAFTLGICISFLVAVSLGIARVGVLSPRVDRVHLLRGVSHFFLLPRTPHLPVAAPW